MVNDELNNNPLQLKPDHHFLVFCRSVKLLFENCHEKDILWKHKLDELADVASPRSYFSMQFTLND